MNIGYIIRNERIRQGIKQSILAKGICTPSYLSRIENEKVIPNEEISNLLLSRLSLDNIESREYEKVKEKDTYRSLLKIYKEVISMRDKEFTRMQLNIIEKNQNSYKITTHVHRTYLLISLRLKLIIGEDLDNIEKEIEIIEKTIKFIDSYHLFLFLINKALFQYAKGNFVKTIHLLEECSELLGKLNLELFEIAELNYMLGLAYASNNNFLLSIEYTQKAQNYFTSNFVIKRVLDCYMIIGICYKKTKRYDLALDIYLKSKELCTSFGYKNKLGMIYHNLGALFAIRGDTEKAKNYYHQSLEYKESISEKPITVLALIIEHSKHRNKKEILYWCNEGISIVKKIENEQILKFKFQFEFYLSFYSDNGLDYELAENTINYFESLQDYNNCRKYCIALAEYYVENKKYKLATHFFNKANLNSFATININTWGEL